MKNELETLRAELHKEVDAKIDKLIKPEFELNRWYKSNIGNLAYFENKNDDEYLYGIVEGCFTKSAISYKNLNGNKNWTLATPTEVKEALEKEAVKRYKDNNKVKCLLINSVVSFDLESEIRFNSDTNSLFCGRIKLFDNGIFATPIKTITIDELAKDFVEYYRNACNNSYEIDFKIYLTKEKSKIIETLNNL